MWGRGRGQGRGIGQRGRTLINQIVGLCNTSYYVRGQYTLIDTLPLCRESENLYPPPGMGTAIVDGTEAAFQAYINGPGAIPNETDTPNAGPSSNTETSGSSTPTPLTQTTQPTQPPQTTAINTSNSPTSPTATASPLARTISRNILLKTKSRTKSKANVNISESAKPKRTKAESKIMTKEGVYYLTPGQTFNFNFEMPHTHYRDSSVELPPSCQIYQVGMQAGVEYVLRIKMGRKGWRLNET